MTQGVIEEVVAMSKNQRPFLLGALIIVPLCLCLATACASLMTYFLLGEQTKDDLSGVMAHRKTTWLISMVPLGQAIFFENKTELRVTVADKDCLDTDHSFTLSAWVKPAHYRNGQGRNSYHIILFKWWVVTPLSVGDLWLLLYDADRSGRTE